MRSFTGKSKRILFFGRVKCNATEELLRKLVRYEFEFVKSWQRGEQLPQQAIARYFEDKSVVRGRHRLEQKWRSHGLPHHYICAPFEIELVSPRTARPSHSRISCANAVAKLIKDTCSAS